MRVTRRGVLTTLGVTAIAGTTRATDWRTGNGGMVVFTYDDSPIEDYTETYPIHQEYGVPGCVAVCPGWMDSSDDYMDTEHVTELADSGWEIMSHTMSHRSVGQIQLTKDVTAGDDRIYVDANRHGQYEGDPLEIIDKDGDVQATATSAGSGVDDDSGGEYVTLESKVERDIDVSGFTCVRYTEEFTRKILVESKAQIEKWGIPVTGFVYPYGRYDGIAEEIVPEYYEAVPNHRTGRDGINPIEDLVPTELIRQYIETDRATYDEIAEFMEEVASRDVLGIVGGHSQYDTLPAERVELSIQSALDYDLEIVTLQEALEKLDILEMPEPPEDDHNGGTDTDNNSLLHLHY